MDTKQNLTFAASLVRAGVAAVVAGLGGIGYLWYLFLTDKASTTFVIDSMWKLGAGIVAIGIASILAHTWENWWGVPRLVRELGDLEKHEQAYDALIKMGTKSLPMFAQ
jgi:hypothetical protein